MEDKVTLTVYTSAYRQGIYDAVRAQMVQFFNVLMSDDVDEGAIERFEAGLGKTIEIESIMLKAITKGQ